MVHVFDEEKKKFVQVHAFKVDMRPSKEICKRMRNTEYAKFLIGIEKKNSGYKPPATVAATSLPEPEPAPGVKPRPQAPKATITFQILQLSDLHLGGKSSHSWRPGQ